MTDLSKITVICATIERPFMIERFIRSVREFYPDVEIVVGDQSKDSNATQDVCAINNVRHLQLPYDCGVAYARNACVKEARTEYILLCDDDFILTNETDLSIPLKAFEKYSKVDIVTGKVIDRHHGIKQERNYEYFIYIDDLRGAFISIPISYFNDIKYEAGGHTFFQTEMGLNFALMRRSMFNNNIKWDEQFKCNGEHEDFYLNIKYNGNSVILYTPELYCDHDHQKNELYYNLREREEGWQLFDQKWNIKERINVKPDPKDIIRGGVPFRKVEGDQAKEVLIKSHLKYQHDRSTIIWKIARPFMKLEQSLRKKIRT